jgi:hypothetical protein
MRFGKVLVYLVAVLLVVSCVPSVMSIPDQKDDDEAGITYSRDDDNEINGFENVASNLDIVTKKLWVYYDDYWESDEIRLYIYGKLYETKDSNLQFSHKIIIDGQLAVTFLASDNYNFQQFIWTYFVIDKSFIYPNSCVQIMITDSTDASKENLIIGVDTTFTVPGSNPDPDNFMDYDRSWTDSEYWDDFDGELMIYFEFVSLDETWSDGHTGQPSPFFDIYLRKDRALGGGIYADICGFEFDWSGMTANYFDTVYKVRLQIYGRACGSINPADDNIEIWVNDYLGVNGQVIEFNPYDCFSENDWYWAGFEIYNVEDRDDWLTNDVNQIYIAETDNDINNNNLRIATTVVGDDDDSWWYFYDEDDDEYKGAGPPDWGDPEATANDMNIMFYIEVFKSNPQNERHSSKMYEVGIINVLWPMWSYMLEDRGIYDPGGLKEDFEDNGWYWLFDTGDHDSTQWRFYGERRSKYDIGGDLADLTIFNGHGLREEAVLQYTMSAWGEFDKRHYNEDRMDFASHHMDTCTEAEGNDESLYENIGSDGLDFDCDWMIFYACLVLKGHNSPTSADNDFLTLLWHGLHGVFGFTTDTGDDEMNDAQADFFDYAWDTDYTIYEAFEESCEDNMLNDWAYYYHTSNADDVLWGDPDVNEGVTPDVLIKTDIDFEHDI